MKPGRWLAILVCSVIVGAGTGLLYLALEGAFEQTSLLRYLPYLGIALFMVSPLVAAWLSGSVVPYAAAAGGLALGIAATVGAAAVNQGGSGAMPITLGVAVGGMVALHGSAAHIWARLVALLVLALFAGSTEVFVSVLFVYPLLGFADEAADVLLLLRRRRRREVEPEAPSMTARS